MFRNGRRLAILAIAASALLGTTTTAGAHAAVCEHAHAAAADTSPGDRAQATVCLINSIRRAHGLATLTLNARLSSAARGHSRDMVRRRYFAHYTPEGLSPAHRVRGAGYLAGHRNWLVGETLAWWRGSATPATIVTGWMHSPPHREVLLHPSFRDVGIGIVLGVPPPGGRNGATYTADFGARW
ncbi:MAG TPA: CAP domain-containing protein [Thermoleophilaceae bacterium]